MSFLPQIATNLSSEKLQRYLNVTGIDKPGAVLPDPNLSTLSKLMLAHQSSFPFENVGIHYESHHSAMIDLDDVFHRLVEKKRGGYCMQHNNFFLHVLRGLGYRCYPCAGKVFDGENFTGFTHQVTIVHIDEPYEEAGLYLVDVGFGNNCIQRPLPLFDGSVVRGRHMEEHRLIYDFLPDSTFHYSNNDTNGGLSSLSSPGSRSLSELPSIIEAQKRWILQFRPNKDSEFSTLYVISPTEYTDADFRVSNYYTSTNPNSIFCKNLIVVITRVEETKADRDPKTNSPLYPINPSCLAQYTLFNRKLTKRYAGETTVLIEEIQTEEERIQVLQDYFGIVLDPGKALKEVRGSQIAF